MSIGKQFIEMTKYQHMGDAPSRMGQVQPPLETPTDTQERIPLPNPSATGLSAPLGGVIEGRRTLRSYSGEPVTLDELSCLLWSCQGVQQITEKGTMRTVPSAGARHAFETYVLVNRVQGLPGGLYRYLALSGELAPVNLSAGIAGTLTQACRGQGSIAASAVTVFWAAEVARMYYRFGERGYRYLFLDAGHACQNLYLAAQAMGCGVCAIGAFDDDKLNKALGLDGVERFAVYGAAVGKKP